MSTFMPADLAVGATRALAQSALPDAPVEPERARPRGFLRNLFRPATRAERPRMLTPRTDPAGC